MNAFNTYLLTSDLSSTIQETKSATENKRLIEMELPLSTRQECLARYRAKKHLLINRTLYGVRKEIADRRLRYNGQFLNGDEEQKIIRVHKLVGNHYLRVKNNNAKIMGRGKVHLSKEKALSKLEKLMPPEIKKRIQNKQQLFQIL